MSHVSKERLLEKAAFLQSATSLSTKSGKSVMKALKPKTDIGGDSLGKAKFAKPPTPEKPKSVPKLKAPSAPAPGSPSLSKGKTGTAKSYSKFKGSSLK